MAKPIQIKCKQCGQTSDRDKAVKISDRIYCCSKECAEMFLESKNNKKKNYKSVKGTARESCTDYIQALYIQNNTPKNKIRWEIIGSQLSNMLKEHKNWNYSTIKFTLQYMNDIAGVNLFDGSQGTILNLVPFYVDEAKDYYFELQDIKKAVNEFEFNDEVIVVKKSENSNKSRMIDMEGI